MALEARGHRVVIDRREWPSSGRRQRDEFLMSARQPTVVYLGATPVGLAIVETSKDVNVQYGGYGKFVPMTEWKGRHVGYTWSTFKEMPCGCLRLLACDPSRSNEWQESRPGQLIGKVEEIARGRRRGRRQRTGDGYSSELRARVPPRSVVVSLVTVAAPSRGGRRDPCQGMSLDEGQRRGPPDACGCRAR